MQKTVETTLEIHCSALRDNFTFIKSQVKPETKIMGVVKAFAYGSDASVIAKELESLSIDYLAVAYTQEGVSLRNHDIKTPILVLHPQPVNFSKIVERCLEPALYSKKIIENCITFAENHNLNEYPIHLKFNTGLNRLGLSIEDIPWVISKLKNTNAVKLKSVFSHLAASEDPNEKKFTQQQINTFVEIKNTFEKESNSPILFHLLNTSGILNYPEAQFDMVRAGIGLYGFGNNEKYNSLLKPIVHLKTVISQIHSLTSGETVGYNRGFVVNKAAKIATLPIGHADGIHRSLGHNNGWVYIHNKKAPIVGNVCMDMIMVDVTEISCQEGDEVILFNDKHTVEELALQNNTISYEFLTAISQRIKRCVLKH